jgi:hypothetical protein
LQNGVKYAFHGIIYSAASIQDKFPTFQNWIFFYIQCLIFSLQRWFTYGGISYNIYREKWDQSGISFEDKNLGFFLIAGVEYFISRKFSLPGRTQFSSIPTKKGSKLDENVKPGGTELSLGLSFYF